ncbi:DNA-binding response regulator [Micromonospora sp. WMMD1102]|uniref:DNA-binding response regulator n=1 Tax=Micromonospora sp. WMMD1102 TaxID=3016105 RepID=UPI002415403C|nr:DNA-binding response regulator [Micromonospora sp. WMMD1102]MDG4784972.1 DNA-binding response regulator [Micromonospora sp. WMMD1102]
MPVVVHVAVVDPLPMFRRGVATVLSPAGHRVETPEDVLAWARSRQPAVVLVTLSSQQSWDLLGALHDAGSAHVVALLEEQTAEQTPSMAGVRAVRAGATSVLSRGSEGEAVLRTVEATADGLAVLPAEVLAALASASLPSGGSPNRPAEERLSWLRQLAAGTTVAELAGRVGYSERAMFRMLRSLYRDMGVQTRMQAVLRAQELGWLPPAADRLSRRP